METIRLFGEIEDIPQNATWDDIERRALTSPVLRQLVDSVRVGHLTREQALIRVALWAANEAVRHHDQIMEWLNTHPQAPFMAMDGSVVDPKSLVAPVKMFPDKK